MNKIMIIAIREFLETVRTKAFFITVVLMPLLIIGFLFGTKWIDRFTEQETIPTRRIALLDETGLLADEMYKQFTAHNQENPNQLFELTEVTPTTAVDSLADEVRTGELYAYLKVTTDVITADAACELGRKDQQLQAGRLLRSLIQAAVVAVRFQQADPPVDPQYVASLQREVPVESIDVRTGEAGKDDVFVRVLVPFAFMFLLFMGIMQISYGLLTSVIEEKTSRVVEVLLSAVSPVQLMAGKIIGMVLVGVLLLCVWGGVGYFAAQARGYGHLVMGQLLIYAALYFVPAFLLFSAILGAIGSACNTLKEAQAMASPITIMNLIPMMLWFPISQNPGSLFAVVLSYIPPITPFVMILRISADPDTPTWQVITTLIILWLSVVAMIWAAGKIFRVGVLMYGKPPTLGELLHWVRYT